MEKNCFQHNECSDPSKNNCSIITEECVQESLGYHCQCKSGFQYLENDGCEDIDECKINIHNCNKNAFCKNTFGSFECECKKNYEGDGFDCEEIIPTPPKINWCSFKNSCGKNAICQNRQSGFWCRCRPGYFGNPDKQCDWKDPSSYWIFETTLSFPVKFRNTLLFTYSDYYFDLSRSVTKFYADSIPLILPGYIENSVQITTVR